jgi:uroporphyrinogen III methyltransferase/synthase
MSGTVYLVGAGPGDPGLITLRGVECLARADVVLYDYLANPAVVGHAPASAERVALGDPDAGRALTPEEISALMVEHARRGRTVVRLKGGDPSVFGRGADETAALRAAGVRYEIVPGITAGLAVAAYCEIPITQQDDASAVALVAGRERRDKAVSRLEYGALARFPGTLVFYMGVGRAAEWRDALIAQGKPADTPVAIVRWCTLPQQRTVRCTLGTVAETVEREGLRPPALFVVGPVVARAAEQPWFASRPLFGTRVLAAGSPATSESLRRRLADLGADVVTQPAIRITDPPDWGPVDAALDRVEQYDWLVFASANGVDYLVRRLLGRGGDLRRLGRAKLAAIGSGTAERLARYHLRADLVPDEFVAESLAAGLVGQAKGRRFLVARASRGRTVLGAAVERAGGLVDQVVVYGSVDEERADPGVVAALAAGGIDWVTVTSSSAARALAHLYGAALGSARFASIGPLASGTLRELGYVATVEASPHTTAALVEAICAARPSHA